MNTKNQETESLTEHVQNISTFVRAAVRLGCRYLAVGGPTSRLEVQIQKAGRELDYITEVFTTPTGVFVSAVSPKSKKVVTFVGRVKEVSFNLNKLDVMESLIQKLGAGETTPEEVLKFIKDQDLRTKGTVVYIKFVGAFVVGALFALISYGSIAVAGLAGVITLFLHLLSGPITIKYKLNPIFSTFLASFIGFGVAALCSHAFKVPMEAVALGGLVILAPGLAITTAISEIAEQNFVSGIVKLVNSAINLCGMLVAYLIILDIVKYLNLEILPSDMVRSVGYQGAYFLRPLLHGGILLGVCMVLQVPKRAVLGVMITGFISWVVVHQFNDPGMYVTATFLATLCVGVVSMIFGSYFKLPSQIFSVPGILTLVPGVMAMTSFQSLAALRSEGLEVGMKVILISSSIVFGLFMARLPFTLGSDEEFGLEPIPDPSAFSKLHPHGVTDKELSEELFEKTPEDTVSSGPAYTISVIN